MPFADLSPHLPGCRYGRPETASRDPIRVSVSYFWVAPAWFFHRNWCLEVIRSVCSSSSTFWCLIFLTLIPFDKHPELDIYLFISLARRGGGVKNVTRESPLRSFLPAFRDTSFKTSTSRIGFSFTGTLELSRSFLFVLDAIFDPSATRLHEPWVASPHLSQINTFYDILEGESVATITLSYQLFICVLLAAFVIAGFRQIDFECFVMSFFDNKKYRDFDKYK